MSKRTIHILLILFLVVGCSSPERDFEGLMEINKTELFVKTMGSGVPIIVVHGGPGLSHDYFLPHLGPLSSHFKLIFYDQRGAGRSSVDVDTASMSMSTFAEDIEALRVNLGLDKIFLLAHSWGAQVASEYAIRYPERLNGLIYAHPSPLTNVYNDQIREKQTLAMDSIFMAKRGSIVSSEAFANQELSAYEALYRLSFSLTFERQEEVNELNLDLNPNFKHTQTLLQSFKASDRNFLMELSSLSAPSLVIHGTNDLTVIEADSALASTLGAELITFETGHFSFVEQQEKFIDAVVEFVNN